MGDTGDLFGSDSEDEQELNVDDPKARLQELARRKRQEQEEERLRQKEAKRARFANDGDAQQVHDHEVYDDENDEEPTENDADQAFIDDDGVPQDEEAPWAEGSDGEEQDDRPVAEEAEEGEDDELERALNKKPKRRKNKYDDLNVKEFVEELLTRMDASKELDRELNSKGQPATEKLKMLPTVEEVLAQQFMHRDLLDGGLMGTLRDWLFPMPDGSLPNIKIRTSILKLLHQLPINTADHHRKNQLRTSKLGEVVMFLYKLPDEIASNRKLAKELVEKWSRPIFYDGEQQQQERLLREERQRQRRQQADEDDTKDEDLNQKGLKPGDAGFRWHARIPQAARLDYIRKPDVDQSIQWQMKKDNAKKASAPKLQRKLKELGKKKTTGRAANVSIEGRGMLT